MKLINPSFEILEQGPGLQGIYKQIELAGRTCYKSLDKITEDSAEGFVNRMIASKHYAMLEHGTVYLKFSTKVDDLGREVHTWFPKGNYKHNPYSRVSAIREELEPETDWQKDFYDKIGITHYYITTNLRVLVENGWLDDLQYLCEPTKFHAKRVTVRFTTDRGVSHEFVRHRVFSFAQESTRYCNYSKDKFGNELTFIKPSWSLAPMYDRDFNGDTFLDALQNSEDSYLDLIKHGWTPQQARQILPNAIKTELVMTGFTSDWDHFFDLRARGTTGAPHPDAKALAEPLLHEFENRNLCMK